VQKRIQEDPIMMELRSFPLVRSGLRTIAAVIVGFVLAVAAGAQTAQEGAGKPATKATPGPDMQKAMESFGPMMGQMMSSMLDGMLVVLAKPETAQRTATFSKNYYDALIAKGFSNEDALKIVMAHGIPMPGGR
jgi:hypothetical protein